MNLKVDAFLRNSNDVKVIEEYYLSKIDAITAQREELSLAELARSYIDDSGSATKLIVNKKDGLRAV